MTDITEQIRALEKRIAFLEKLERPAIACRVRNNAAFSHNSTGNYLAITFNTELWDPYGMHSTSANTSRITITIAGWYLVWGGALFAANATGYRQLLIYLSGTSTLALQSDNAPSASSPTGLSVSTLWYFTAGDWVELLAFQNSGGNLNIDSSAYYTPEFAAMRLS
jgi:hypothetical protein